MLLLLCEKQQPVSRRGKSSLEQIIRRERERTTMPPPAVVCPGMPSSRSACQAHAGAQAGRKRQSFWKTLVWSEPTQRSCQAQQLWPASASASLVLAGTRQTSGERMQPSGDHQSIRAELKDRPHVVVSGRFGADTPGTTIGLLSCFCFALLMSDFSPSIPTASKSAIVGILDSNMLQ